MLKLKSSVILGSFSLLSLAMLSSSGCCGTTCGKDKVADVNVIDAIAVSSSNFDAVSLKSLIDIAMESHLSNDIQAFNIGYSDLAALTNMYNELFAKDSIDAETQKKLSDLALSVYNVRNFADLVTSSTNEDGEVSVQLNQADVEARVKENIALKTTALYLEAAKSQKKKEIVIGLYNECKSRYSLINQLQESRQIAPFVANVEKERTAELEKTLVMIMEEYNANIAKLAEYVPYDFSQSSVDSKILDLSIFNKNKSLDDLYKLALVDRAELDNLNDVEVINYNEYEKLADENISVKASLDVLLGDLYSTSQYNSYFAPDVVELEKRLPMVNNVIANVKYFYNNMAKAEADFMKADKAFAQSEKELRSAIAKTKSKGELAKLELDKIRFESAQYEIEKINALANYYEAYVYLLNVVGSSELIDNLPLDTLADINDSYNEAVKKYEKSDVAVDENVEKVGKTTIRLNELDLINSAN